MADDPRVGGSPVARLRAAGELAGTAPALGGRPAPTVGVTRTGGLPARQGFPGALALKAGPVTAEDNRTSDLVPTPMEG